MKLSRNVIIGLILILSSIILLTGAIVISTPPAGEIGPTNNYFSETLTGKGINDEPISLQVTGRIYDKTEFKITIDFRADTWANYHCAIFTSKEWGGFAYDVYSSMVDTSKPFTWQLEEYWYPYEYDVRMWVQGIERIPSQYGNVNGIVEDFRSTVHPLKVYISGLDENGNKVNYFTWSGITLYKTPSNDTGYGYELSFSEVEPALFYSNSTIMYTLGGISLCLMVAGVIVIKFKEE